MQAIGIALESHRFDIISQIYSQTQDISLLSYTMEAVIDTGFSLSYRDQVLNFLFPLFPKPTADGSPYIHALTRLLVSLSSPSLTVPLLTSLVPNDKLLAYQFAFDLVEGGAQDFLEAIRGDLPEGDSVIRIFCHHFVTSNPSSCRKRKKYTTTFETSSQAKNPSNYTSNSSNATTTSTCSF